MRCRNWLMFCFLILSNFLITASLQAQHLQRPLRIITTREGLPQSFISGLVQDKDGFVWIGTRNGLARYDGMHFKLFQHDNNDSAALNSNLIISLKPDKNNKIWIEHESSNIDCIDPVTETIDHITARPLFRSNPIQCLRRGWLGDIEGNLWGIQLANGLYKYDWKNNKVTHFIRKAHTLPDDTLRGMLEDHHNDLWVLSRQGISRYIPGTRRFEDIPFPFPTNFISENLYPGIIAFHERKNGELMVGDRRQLIFYNPDRKSFRTVPLSWLPKTGIQWIQTGPDGYEYLESEGIVYRYDDTNGLIAIGDIGLTSFRDAESFLVDHSGLIWLGTNAAGIHQIDLSAPFFESYTTKNSFHYDLLLQELGISLDEFSGWPLSNKQFKLSSYYLRSIYDSQHRLWIALRSRIGYYDLLQKKFVPLPPVPGISNTNNLPWGIRGISFAPQGALWIISDRNYVGYFDTLKQQWVQYLDSSQLQKINSNITLHDIVADQDKLWIASGSGDGLLSIDADTKQVLQLSRKKYHGLFPTDLLLGLKPDPTRPELLWIGTYEGLVCLNKKTLKSEIFSVHQGLPDNTIYSIEIDKAGYLWLSTNKGLCRFHPVTHQVRIFQIEDGLPGNEFNRFHHLQLPDGRLAFGGTDGWVLYDPTTIKADNYQPPVAFTDLKINNAPSNDTSKSGLTFLNSISVLSLPYDQNTLAIEFAGLEFNQPRKLMYRYQLKNYDDKWIVTSIPTINYTKLPPGHYTLNINSTNTTGQWSSKIRTLSVVIRPPFWRTWWAYSLYILLLIGLIWVYIQYRINRERMQQEVLLREKEAIQLKAVDELKTRFFSNITHEFRTPLTLILIPLQRLKLIFNTPDSIRWTTAIERNANQLLRLINQLLDFSKLESGTLKVNETRGNICDTIEEFLRSFYDEAKANGIHLEFTSHCDLGDYWFDADKLEQIIRNLIANALKFTSKDGKVEVVCHTKSTVNVKSDEIPGKPDSSASGLFITVRDTGIGIPEDQLPFIFNRFYQIDNVSAGRSAASHPKGSGIGLALVKELVDLQGGTIEVSSSKADGNKWHTAFNIWLPYRPATAGNEPNERSISKEAASENALLISESSAIIDNKVELKEASEAIILLVEDNNELAEFIADSLPESYNISHASNGAEGLAKSLELMPELIISDVLMRVMDGYEFCGKIKNDERTNHIPVILLTAKATFDNRIEGLSLGADDYLTKPFHIKELQLRVHNLLERQRLVRDKIRQELSQPQAPQIQPSIKPQTDLQNAFIKKLYDLVEEKLDDPSFGVLELAFEVGMSRATLHRKLKAISDLSAIDIIRNYRLKRATQYLKEGFNSSETAYKVGFESPAYFTKCFREFYNITPLEFMQQKS